MISQGTQRTGQSRRVLAVVTVILGALFSACPTPLDTPGNAPDLLIQACLNRMACNEIPSLSICLTNTNKTYIFDKSHQKGRIDCMAAAKTCDELRACRVFRYHCPPDPKGIPTCEPGYECLEGVSGQSWCGTGFCDASQPWTRCEGNVEIDCRDGIEIRRNCEAVGPGVLCEEGLGCTGAGHPCSYSRCEDGKIIACIAKKETEAMECYSPHVPLSCPSDSATCLPDRELECDPITFIGLCSNDSLTFCDGYIRMLSCKEWGFQGCTFVEGDWHARCYR